MIRWFAREGNRDGAERENVVLGFVAQPNLRHFAQGLEQTWQYMDRCGADEGHLVISDRDPAKAWDDKIFCRPARRQDTPITVWGM